MAQQVKNPPAMQETQVTRARSLVRTRKGVGNPLQDSCLNNSMDRGAWWLIVHGVEKSWTRLRD